MLIDFKIRALFIWMDPYLPDLVLSVLSPSQQPTVLFSIYQNNTWIIRHLVNEMIDPATLNIVLKIVRFHVELINLIWSSRSSVFLCQRRSINTLPKPKPC